MTTRNDRTGEITIVPLGDLFEDDLRSEILRLTAALEDVRNCIDPKCTLCGKCLRAIYPQHTKKAAPSVAGDDRIRGWRRKQKPHIAARNAAV